MEDILVRLENPEDLKTFQLPTVPADQVLNVIEEKYQEYINNPNVTLEDTAKTLSIGKERLKKIFVLLGYPIKERGRPKKKFFEEDVYKILEIKAQYDIGYKRIKESYFEKVERFTFNDAFKIFNQQHLFTFHRHQKIDEHPHEYVAQYVNQLWHTDLKFLKDDNGNLQYLISFLDDRSRYIICWDVFDTKEMKNTARVFRHAIDLVKLVPHGILTDNGTEFIGKDFEAVCQEFNIKHFKTHPYSPEENGKIERSWETLFKTNPGVNVFEFIPNVVSQYNRVWKHSALFKLFGEKLTPFEAWERGPKWTKDLCAEPGFKKNLRD